MWECPVFIAKEACCERDYDEDGNCDRHLGRLP
jgi:hypothetical protein